MELAEGGPRLGKYSSMRARSRSWVAAQLCAPWPGSITPVTVRPAAARAIMASSMPDEPEKVKMAKSTRAVALSICFMISSSGAWSGANSTFTGIPPRL
ncbi:hypothetical protein [Planomonospora algeriensis]